MCERLGESIIPFTVILVVPVLRRICDVDWYVRTMASKCFASLIKLYPLSESAADLPPVSSGDNIKPLITNERLIAIKASQQEFLDQLMDQRKLRAHELPNEVLIEVNLRPYQQMGVNWLGFLKKFNLHGILCDDMG